MTLGSFAALAERVIAARPRAGSTRVVLVDGPSGSGKTTFADRLSRALDGAPTVHMDDLYPGWDGLAEAVPRLVRQVLEPLASGQAAAYERYDWTERRYADVVAVGRPELLIIEGCGCGVRAAAVYAVLVAWVQAPRDLRLRRGIERDGSPMREHWERWFLQEDALFAAERTRERADLRIDGAPREPHDPDRQWVALPPGS